MCINRTLVFYSKNAKQFIKQTLNVDMQVLYTPFIDALPSIFGREQRILDLGCGSGRDSLYFANQGFNVTAIDGSQTLIDLVTASNNSTHGIHWVCLNFSDLAAQNWNESFTGIWACASLLHVSYVQLPSLIETLLDMLTTEGVIYASFKYGDSERIDNGRFFCDLNEERWALIKHRLHRRIEDEVWITQDKRVHRNDTWFNVLIKPC